MTHPDTLTVTSRDGTRIAYDKLGQGPLLIFITGATCFRAFQPVAKDARHLAASFTVINFDRRGRGDSGDAPAWSPEREVEDIESLIDAHGGKAVVYGHSSGAVLAIEAGLRLPGKVERVILYDPAYVHEDERREYDLLRGQVTGLLGEARHPQAVKTFLGGIGMPRIFRWLLPLMPGWRSMVRLAPTLAYDMALTREPPPLDRVAVMSMPVLVLVGGKNPQGMQRVASQLAAALPDARLDVVPGQDHLVDAAVLLPRFVDFCDQV